MNRIFFLRRVVGVRLLLPLYHYRIMILSAGLSWYQCSHLTIMNQTLFLNTALLTRFSDLFRCNSTTSKLRFLSPKPMHFLRHGFGILAEDGNLWLVESDMNKHARSCMMEDIY